MIIYVIQRGDSVYSIAKKFGLSEDKIIADNRITNPQNLVVGQSLVLVTNQITHTVQPGDSLYSIAQAYGVPFQSVVDANPQVDLNGRIYPGEQIIVPLPNEKIGEMEVNGYVFPNVSNEVLDEILPHITYLSIFSYQARPDGSLVTLENDVPIIEKARAQRVAPLMVVTNIGESGGFSGEITNEIFASEQAQNALVENILNVLQTKNYYGVDMDFEYLFPEDRENYNNFLRKLTARLHPLGYIVTTAVAPKISEDQQGTLYEGHDYRAHGEIVDHVIIMTYEWGYTYGPPMAVAPLNAVKQVLDYAVTAIPPEKILMGIPNYGYVWNLPYVPGTAARAISNVGAVDLAQRVGSFIEYDQRAQSPNFQYYNKEGRKVVWFEDARSVDAKLKLVNQYGLGGVSYWTLNQSFPQLWLVQENLYDTIKVL